MTRNSFFADAQNYVESCSPLGLTLTGVKVLDHAVELTLALTTDALDRFLRTQLRSTGTPSDWNRPEAPMGPGSPSWAYAVDLTELLNRHYFTHALLERHEAALAPILAGHGHDGGTVSIRPAYTPGHLALNLLRLKAEHLHSTDSTALKAPAA